MKRRDLFRMLALASLGTGTCLSGSPGEASPAAPHGTPQRELFRVGQTKNYGNGLRVTFLSVKKDTRCPTGLKCDSEGSAAVVLRVRVGDQAAQNYTIHTNRSPRRLVIPGEAGKPNAPSKYVLEIVSLSPERFSFVVNIKQGDYRLDLQARTVF